MANAPFTTQGPKSRRRTRRDLPNGQVRRWDKRPGSYTPNIERADKLAPQFGGLYVESPQRYSEEVW